MNFDNILVKAKEVFESAYKKTENVVSAQKQRFDASSIEAKLAKNYEELGKICYGAYLNEKITVSDLGLKGEISTTASVIEELKKDLLKTKNKKVCPHCNCETDKSSSFCNDCGYKFTDDFE